MACMMHVGGHGAVGIFQSFSFSKYILHERLLCKIVECLHFIIYVVVILGTNLGEQRMMGFSDIRFDI